MAPFGNDAFDPQALYQNAPDEDQLQSIHFGVWGGGNWNDQADSLIGRAYQPNPYGGFDQRYPVEMSDTRNLDFDIQGIKKRNGSAALDSITAILQSSDTIVDECEFTDTTGTRIRVAAGVRGLYCNSGGTWQQMIRSSTVTYTSVAAVSKVRFLVGDGKLFILLNGTGNPIQVYRTGATLDDEAYNQTATTTYNGTGTLTSTATMSVASVAGFNIGDRILAGAVPLYIKAFGTGTSIIAVTAPGSGNPVTSGATVATANQYTNVYSGSQSTYTGTWGTGYYLGFFMHNHFCFGIGDTVWEYCNINKPYDRLLGGFYQANGRIVAAEIFSNRYGDQLREFGMFGTTAGMEYISGFDAADTVMRVEGTRPPLNHRCMRQSNDWMIVLGKDRSIFGFNMQQVVNLGRRFRAPDGSGPLDTMNLSISESTAFGFFHPTKKQLYFFIADAETTTNNRALILDFQLGEPVYGEDMTSFERRVRLLVWTQTGPWYCGMFNYFGGVGGVLAAGTSWTIDSGADDYATTAIVDYGISPEFTAGTPTRFKQFRHFTARSLPTGNWNVNVQFFLNRDNNQVGPTFSWLQILVGSAIYDTSTYDVGLYGSSGVTKGHKWIDFYAESMRFKFYNQTLTNSYTINNMEIGYEGGARGD